MKNKDLFAIRKDLQNLKKHSGEELSYRVVKMIRKIDDKIENLREVRDSYDKDQFEEFSKKQGDLIREYADKDENGELVLQRKQDGGVVFNFSDKDSREKYKEELKKLEDEYESVLTQKENKEKEYENLLDKEVDFQDDKFKLEPIPISSFSDPNTIKVEEWENLIYFNLIDFEGKFDNKSKSKKKKS